MNTLNTKRDPRGWAVIAALGPHCRPRMGASYE
jgi:hypothetical protein